MKIFTLIFILIHAMIIPSKSQQLSESFKKKILCRFEKKVKNNKDMNTGLLLIHSDSLNIHWKTAAHHDSSVQVHPDQPYHFASIGKTITSVMISILYEKKLLQFDDKISNYLDQSVLEGLHIYKGQDYSNEITLSQLLNHTSGLPDYYTDKNSSNIRMQDLMLSEPERFWTPIETINWAKTQLKPKFKPGKGFHYSDTNYQLLGLIIEKITGMKLHEAFHKFIFEPLEMNNTYQIFYSEPKIKNEHPIVDLYYNGINLLDAKSISMSWASGGIVSTSEDMLKFMKALVGNEIIRKETFNQMQDYAKMGISFYYGYGIMNFRFMMMYKKYGIWGNSGSTGAFMYYNPLLDIYMIGSYHKINCQVQPIFHIFNTLRRINKQINR